MIIEVSSLKKREKLLYEVEGSPGSRVRFSAGISPGNEVDAVNAALTAARFLHTRAYFNSTILQLISTFAFSVFQNYTFLHSHEMKCNQSVTYRDTDIRISIMRELDIFLKCFIYFPNSCPPLQKLILDRRPVLATTNQAQVARSMHGLR